MKRRKKLSTKRNKIRVNTPMGTLCAERKGTLTEYPGFYVSLANGKEDTEYAIVEYDQVKGCVQVVVYKDDALEPDIIAVRWT